VQVPIICATGQHLLEDRLNVQLVHRRDQATDVVTKDFAQHFILHGDIRFASDRIAELRLHHCEGRLDI
jgi:hypothetical protein